MKNLIPLVILVFCFVEKSYSQNDITQKSYLELSEAFHTFTKDTLEAKKYVNAYIKKAKKTSNFLQLAEGYYMITKISGNKDIFLYCDSIIEITRKKNDFNYPAKAHIKKAQTYGLIGKYKESIKELVIANISANENKNIKQQYKIKYFIALLKDNLGEYEETLEIFKSIKKYHEKKYLENKEENIYDYIKAIYALGNSFNDNKKYDSAYYENKKAIKLSLKSKDSILYENLLLSSGVTHYFKKEYDAAIDSIAKFDTFYKSKDRTSNVYLTTSYFYLGKIHSEKNQIDKAVSYLEKVDSLTFKRKNFFPKFRSTYEILIKSYKEKGNTTKQLYYIDRLLQFDSINNKEFKHLYKKINQDYSTPNLIFEKQEIINSLKKNNNTKIISVIILSVFSFLLIIILFFINKKKKVYERRFSELLDKHQDKNNTPKEFNKVIKKQETKDIGISDVIVDDILKRLSSFEENEGFLKPNLTINMISKDFRTNSKYLSRVINIYKDKGFSSYINDLRVDFVIKKLKTDSKFRKYTIKAIAQEIGFNTTEAFSRSFYKSTGIYPSFFLKQLEKEYEVTNK